MFLYELIFYLLKYISIIPLAGSYFRDVSVSVFEGKMHPVDSNEIVFKTSELQAFRKAFLEAEPLLLESIYKLKILCTESQVGAVLGDLQSSMDIVDGMKGEGSFQKITVKVPLSKLYRYSSSFRGIAHDRAIYLMYSLS